MAQPVVDISVFGDKQLAKDLASFESKVQKKIVRPVIRASAKRNKKHVERTWQQHADEGTMSQAMRATKVRAGKRSRSQLRVEWPLPTGKVGKYALGHIHNSVEYGHGNVPAKAYTRRTVNAHTKEEHAEMGRHIGRGVESEARKHFKKTRGVA